MRLALATLGMFGALIGPAQAATFIAIPPSTVTAGDGPYGFSAVSTGGSGYESLAYKLPTEDGWHRCVGHSATFLLGDLPPGNYPIAIADDVNINYWAAKGMANSGITAGCKTTDAPGTLFTVFWLTVIDAPATSASDPPSPPIQIPAVPSQLPTSAPLVTPAKAQVAPATAPLPSARCRTAKQALTRANRAVSSSRREYLWHRTRARRKVYEAAKKRQATERLRVYRYC